MTFCPGQRIKKVRGTHNIGATATVTRITSYFTYVITDCVMSNQQGQVFPVGSEWFLSNESDWEPIVPPGLESNEEINALYEPEVVTVEKRA